MGKRNRPLAYQFLRAIDAEFDGGGKDKHSIKKEAQSRGKQKALHHVYGYKDREGLVAFSHQLGKYIKENYSSVKLVKDVNSEMVQKFLNYKAKDCSQASLETYASYARKIGRITNHVYNAKTTWERDVVEPVSLKTTSKIRTIAMRAEDCDKLEALSLQSRSKAKYSISLARKFGLRVSEIAKLQSRDINLKEKTLHIHNAKGKKSRDIKFNDRGGKFLKDITQGLGPCDRIVPIKEDSINRHLERLENKLEIRDRYRDANTGIHCIRKLRAQEYYDECRECGMGIQSSLSETSVYLGHGAGRDGIDETIRQYVLNVW